MGCTTVVRIDQELLEPACMRSIYVGRQRGIVLAPSRPQPSSSPSASWSDLFCPLVLQSSCRIFIVSKPIQQSTNAVGNTKYGSIVQKSFAKLLVDGTGKRAGDSALRKCMGGPTSGHGGSAFEGFRSKLVYNVHRCSPPPGHTP